MFTTVHQISKLDLIIRRNLFCNCKSSCQNSFNRTGSFYLGTNDITRNRSDTDEVNVNATSAVNCVKSRSPNAKIGLCTSIPRKGKRQNILKFDETTQSVNNFLAKLSKKDSSVSLIDTFNIFCQNGNAVRLLYNINDPSGVYISDKGVDKYIVELSSFFDNTRVVEAIVHTPALRKRNLSSNTTPSSTEKQDDVVIPDDSLFDILDDFEDDNFVSYLYDYQNVCDSNVSLKRCSKDSSVPNNHGYKLIDFCKRNNLYIGNSRLPGNDYMIGLTTCKSVSLIDYLLLSSSIFPLIQEFNVLEFNPLFSDVHCGLCFCFHASVNIFTAHSDDNCSSQRGHAQWVPDEENRFIETLISDVTKLDEISVLLSEDSNDPKERINIVVDKIGDIFKSTANRVFKLKGKILSIWIFLPTLV
ncbi:unnamed protein product [Mytilus coruscus]|uniref:Uncharacterized protein n=1 Tax=Mytilus coruscus TaxID=42192 RepID=A0A6J8B7U4_MYTCO|nr:unnamed protein product [Mytilus coruscus]